MIRQLILSLVVLFSLNTHALAVEQSELIFVNEPELYKIASEVQALIGSVQGPTGSETYVYVNAQWLQLSLNSALKQGALMSFLYSHDLTEQEKIIVKMMAHESNTQYLSFLQHYSEEVDAMIAAHKNVENASIKNLLNKLKKIYDDIIYLYKDMEDRADKYLSPN